MMKAPKLFGEVMATLIIRRNDSIFWLILFTEKTSGKWTALRIARYVEPMMWELRFTDSEGEIVSDRVAAKMITALALKNKQRFWNVDLEDNCYHRKNSTHGVSHSFKGAVESAIRTFNWSRLE